MSWNIRPGFEDEHFEFFVQEFGPGLTDLGVQTTDAWLTYYGDHPQILTGAVTEDLEGLRRALSSDTWRRLKGKLLTYVTDYSQKIVRGSGGFQL